MGKGARVGPRGPLRRLSGAGTKVAPGGRGRVTARAGRERGLPQTAGQGQLGWRPLGVSQGPWTKDEKGRSGGGGAAAPR